MEQRTLLEMTDVQNDYWTSRCGRFVSVAEVEKLVRAYNRKHKTAKWKRECRVVNGKKAFRVPGTREDGVAAMHSVARERFIATGLDGGSK